MIFILNFIATIVGAAVHLYRTPASHRTRQRVIEVFLLYFLCVQWGFGAASGRETLRLTFGPEAMALVRSTARAENAAAQAARWLGAKLRRRAPKAPGD